VLKEMEEGKKKKKFMERDAYAYWKGNPFVASPSREDLLTCNLSSLHDWNARIFIQVCFYNQIYLYLSSYAIYIYIYIYIYIFDLYLHANRIGYQKDKEDLRIRM